MTTSTAAASEQNLLRAPRALADNPTTSMLTVNGMDHERQASRVAQQPPQLTINQEAKQHGVGRRKSAFGVLPLVATAGESDMKYTGSGRFAIHLKNDENDVQSAKTIPLIMGVPQIGVGMERQEYDLESDSGY